MASAYELGYNTAARYDRDGREFDPEQHARKIVNTFSHPEVQVPRFVEGAKAYPDLFAVAIDELWKMRGRDLLKRLDIDTWLNTPRTFVVLTTAKEQVEWKAWQTFGRGRQHGKTYLHLSAELSAKIVTEGGEDTGVRMPETVHARGLTSEPISEMQFV